jgi:hypothetical protein
LARREEELAVDADLRDKHPLPPPRKKFLAHSLFGLSPEHWNLLVGSLQWPTNFTFDVPPFLFKLFLRASKKRHFLLRSKHPSDFVLFYLQKNIYLRPSFISITYMQPFSSHTRF